MYNNSRPHNMKINISNSLNPTHESLDSISSGKSTSSAVCNWFGELFMYLLIGHKKKTFSHSRLIWCTAPPFWLYLLSRLFNLYLHEFSYAMFVALHVFFSANHQKKREGMFHTSRKVEPAFFFGRNRTKEGGGKKKKSKPRGSGEGLVKQQTKENK